MSTAVGKVAKTDATGKIDYSVLPVKFGGTGADGALAITSGTTTIDCANAAVVTKNYTSISITGTGKLAFTNPHANGTIVVLKSQGDVTLTSSSTAMIDMSAMGASAGTGAPSSGGAGVGAAGSDGNATCYIPATCGGRGGANNSGSSSAGAGLTPFAAQLVLGKHARPFQVGSGGGGGGDGGSGGNAGGKGGGGIIIECNGAWNFTTTNGISVAGANGTNAIASGGSGGGGGAGFLYVLYTTLAANSGTVNVAGGTGASSGGASCNAGAGGASQYTNGSVGGAKNQAGGNGAAGWSLIAQNTEFL